MIKVTDETFYKFIPLPPKNEYEKLIVEFHKVNVLTEKLENMGGEYFLKKNLLWSEVKEFIQSVTAWGGVERARGKIFNGDYNNTITNRFQQAVVHLHNKDIDKALEVLTKIDGFGLSVATKHLRFLFPQECPVLDSILRAKLGYSEDIIGYKELRADLEEIRKQLQKNNPLRKEIGGKWFLADIEACIFQYFREPGNEM